ncbi:hypothetical protein OHB53_09835 [Streptomyces sp. NBC_00056]|uniref:hypothetical protein n=1 Tax=Streptomyces sp. NBC_00056 TaxID=2975633 RepID=UPI003246D6CD
MDDEAITIRLTRDQAFVLPDWLYQVMFAPDDLDGVVRKRAVWSSISRSQRALSPIFLGS